MTAAPRKKRLSRDEQRVIRYQQILDAAWSLFCEKGYDSIIIDEVAERAGCSRMPIYSLFGDKQNLFFELWKTQLSAEESTLLLGCKPKALLTKNLDAMANNLVKLAASEVSQASANLFLAVQIISLSRSDIRKKINDISLDIVTEFAKVIEYSSLAKNEALNESPEAIAYHLIAYINGSTNVKFQTNKNMINSKFVKQLFRDIAIAKTT